MSMRTFMTSHISARPFLPAGSDSTRHPPQESAGGHWLAVSILDYVGSGILSDLCFMLVSVSLIH